MNASVRKMPVRATAGARARAVGGLWAPAVLLVVSGMAALIFQILWIKQLSLIVGVEVHAIALAVSAFFFGLAVGSAWLGRVADRSANPLRLYAGIELGVALLALGVTWALSHGAAQFARAEQAWSWAAWLTLLGVVVVWTVVRNLPGFPLQPGP